MLIIEKIQLLCPNRLLLLFLAIFAVAHISLAQGSVSFTASSDAREVLVNNYFEVSFNLKNANGSDFTPPNFNDFIVLAGPNSSTSMQIINGQVSREMSYSYTIQAPKEGTFTIGPASIVANGKTLRSDPLTIKVLKGNNSAGDSADERQAYVAIEPNKTIAYPGEQILLDFKLYTTVSLDGYDITQEPDYRGFFVQELRRFNSRTQREVINGKQVTTKVLRRLALFPQQTGELTIPSATFQLAVVQDNNRSGFFFRRNVKPVFVTTEPVTIQVKELPSGAPGNFTGAVGNFGFQATANRMQATTDDAISITMMLTGDGDMKRVQSPPLLLSDSFEIYPPKVIEDKVSEVQGQLQGSKVIEYLVLPLFAGNYSIAPSFSYFQPESGTYQTISSGPYPLLVKQGTDRHTSRPGAFEQSTSSDDIRFIKLETTLHKKGQHFVGSSLFWGLSAFPIVAFLGMLLLKQAKNKNKLQDLTLLKRKHANKVAQQRLDAANGFLQSSSARSFYDEISKASLGYICDKLNLPLSELTKDNVNDKLTSLEISQSLIDSFLNIIKTCEMALYAGLDNSQDMKSTYEKAISVISGIEEEIGEL